MAKRPQTRTLLIRHQKEMSAFSQPMHGLSQSTQHCLDKVCDNLHILTTHKVIMDSLSHLFSNMEQDGLKKSSLCGVSALDGSGELS